MEIENKTIYEINSEIQKLENKLNFYLSKKDMLSRLVMPKSVDYSKEIVDGGIKNDNILEYVIRKEEIDHRINEIQNEMFILVDYVEAELQRMKEYNEIEERIIYYRECLNMKWEDIANKVYYSKMQCHRIYKKYLKKRDIS